MKFTNSLTVSGTMVALANAQVTTSENGTISCPVANGTYCAGANIIIRCSNGVGHAGNCNDNLAGEPPLGVNYAPCFACSATSGTAACSKNGIVYPGSGSGLGSDPFPANSTTVCAMNSSNSTGAPFPNGTNPGGPIVNATSYSSTGLPKPSSNLSTSVVIATPTLSSSYGGATTAAPNSSSGITAPISANAATSVSIMGAGAVVGFGALFVALGMM